MNEHRRRGRFPRGNPLLQCGAEGSHHGSVVGCCYICGRLLCEDHLFYENGSGRFGAVDGMEVEAMPLLCREHAGRSAQPGWPPPPALRVRRRSSSRSRNRGERRARGRG